jgi:isopenicillin-N N-acyltransferase like protein
VSEPRIVVAEGDPVTRGRAVGRALRDLISDSLDFYHRYLDARGVTSPQLQELLTPYMAAAESSAPELTAMISGMAEGAMVPIMELYAVNAFEELEPLLHRVDDRPLFLEKKGGGGSVQRCTSFAVRAGEQTLLGHNEQWLAGDAGNVAVVIERPGPGHAAVASPINVCCLPSVGINEHGVAMGIQSVTASDDKVGVPRVLVSRSVLSATDADDLVRRASAPNRSGGYGYSVAIRGGRTLTVETSGERSAVRHGDAGHTNHYLDPELAAIAPDPGPGSRSRYERISELLRSRPPQTPEDAMTLLRDHDSTPASVCLHPDPKDGDDAECIVYSMVAEVETGRLWVAAGNPCEHDFHEIDLAEAFG